MILEEKKDPFNCFLPATVEKARDKDDHEVMRIKGVASTGDKDFHGEFMDPDGLDVSSFLKEGHFNYHHTWISNPMALIGRPDKAYIKNKKLHVEGTLFNGNPMSRQVFDMMKVLEKEGKKGFGLSVEGMVTSRDKDNPKIIKSINITGIAVTPVPINPSTFVEVMKGKQDTFTTFDYDNKDNEYLSETFAKIEKQDSLKNGTLGVPDSEEAKDGKDKDNKEHISKAVSPVNKAMSKSDVWDNIVENFTTNPARAIDIFNIIKTVSKDMNDDVITQEHIAKAKEILGIGSTPVAPAIPVAQAVPATPVAPAIPVAQAVPATPVAPAIPVAQAVPATPVAPAIPVAPVAQAVPATPVAPAIPVAPVAQAVPVALGVEPVTGGEQVYKSKMDSLAVLMEEQMKKQGEIIEKFNVFSERLDFVEKAKMPGKGLQNQSFVPANPGDLGNEVNKGVVRELSISTQGSVISGILMKACKIGGDSFDNTLLESAKMVEATNKLASTEEEARRISDMLKRDYNVTVTI